MNVNDYITGRYREEIQTGDTENVNDYITGRYRQERHKLENTIITDRRHIARYPHQYMNVNDYRQERPKA